MFQNIEETHGNVNATLAPATRFSLVTKRQNHGCVFLHEAKLIFMSIHLKFQKSAK